MAEDCSSDECSTSVEGVPEADTLRISVPTRGALERVLHRVVPGIESDIELLVPSSILPGFTRGLVYPCWLGEFQERGQLAVRQVDRRPVTTTVALTKTDDYSLVLPTNNPDIEFNELDQEGGASVREAFETGWQAGEPVAPQVESYSTLLNTLESRVDQALAVDARTWLGPTPEQAVTEPAPEPVSAILLLAARRRAQLYHLSRWADANGVASIATCSNRKRVLETAGLIETEPVETAGGGRPRQRLLLGDDALTGLGVRDLFAAAQPKLDELESLHSS